jgi:formylglycine-generating enzyme required for sulfatase activity
MRSRWVTAGFLLVLLMIVWVETCGAAARPTERVSPAPAVNPAAVVWRTPEPPTNPQAGDVWINPKDGGEMVYVAAGEFTLGTSDAQVDSWLKEHPADEREWFKDEQPQCRVNLPGCWIGRAEVTNAQYLRFVQATGQRAPDHWEGGQIPSGLERFPVVNVSWDDARAYCQWAGGRLPTELEWEKAARGADGRLFPWGNAWDSKRCRNLALITGKQSANFDEWVSAMSGWLASHDPEREGPAAVGSYPSDASSYGCLDMAGNALEWCDDWYERDAYKRYARGDLTPPRSGAGMVLRGGSWSYGDPRVFRCADRNNYDPDCRYGIFIGFRCARGPG